MKLLFVSPAFYPATYYGGPIYSNYNIAKGLAEEEVDVFVATTNANGKKKLNVTVNKFTRMLPNLFVKYYGFSFKSGFSLVMFFLLWKDIRKADLIFLISVFSPSTPLTLFFSFIFHKKVILSPRGQLGEWCLKQGNTLKKLWLSLFITPVNDKVVWDATSQFEKSMIQRVYKNADVVIIPGTISINDFCSDKNHKDYSAYLELTGKDFSGSQILISVGRLHKVKGFDILIKAFNIIKNKFPSLILLIAGEDYGERKNLGKLISSLSLENRVFLTGNLEEHQKKDFFLNADIFAMASHHENFGIAYAEAMAAGLPVIASKNSPWENIEKYNCGKWVENTPEAFAESLTAILNSDYKSMGARGKEYMSKEFDTKTTVLKYISLFNSILNKKPDA